MGSVAGQELLGDNVGCKLFISVHSTTGKTTVNTIIQTLSTGTPNVNPSTICSFLYRSIMLPMLSRRL